MRTSPHAYAQALLDLTNGLSKQEIEKVIGNFLTELKDRHSLSQINKIIAQFERLSDKAEGIVRATVTSAHKLSKESLDEASALVKKKTKAKEIEWIEVLDPAVLGGVIIASGDFIIDMSLANRVADLGSRIKE